MPADIPPKDVCPHPRFAELPAGSFLWRVKKRTVPAASGPATSGPATPGPAASGPASPFRPPPTDPMAYDARWSGRFDPTPECQYSYCYAAFDDLTAICEVLLRDVGFAGPERYLTERDIAGRQLAILETRRPLWLVSLLDAADLAAACQDSWLLHAEPGEYRITQRWAHWLRASKAPDDNEPAGLIWLSKRAPGGRVVLLFGDRCEDSVLASSFGERPLDGAGLDWLNLRLSLLRTKVVQ
jgi:hypothetical protein